MAKVTKFNNSKVQARKAQQLANKKAIEDYEKETGELHYSRVFKDGLTKKQRKEKRKQDRKNKNNLVYSVWAMEA